VRLPLYQPVGSCLRRADEFDEDKECETGDFTLRSSSRNLPRVSQVIPPRMRSGGNLYDQSLLASIHSL
jgi:hypothetical protein